MRILAIDTTGPGCDVALVEDGGVRARSQRPGGRGQDAALALQVGGLMDEAGVSWASLDRIAVVTGPGSFTGTRIGVSFARGLALVRNVPAIGVSRLHAALPETERIPLALVLLPAQTRPPEKTWWGQLFSNGKVRSDPFEMDLPALKSAFREGFSPVFAPDDPDLLDIFDALHPVGADLAARAGLIAAELSPELDPPVPAYVRRPDAVPSVRS